MSTSPKQLFVASTGPAAKPNYQLYSTDGTAAGTMAITSGGPPTGTSPADLVEAGSLTFFTAVDSSNARQVYATDGTAITRLDPSPNSLSDTYTGAANLTPFTLANGTVLVGFIANVGTTANPILQLFASDGTAAGTRQLTTGAGLGNDQPITLKVSGNTLYVAGGSRATQVYATSDGKSVAILDPNPNSLSPTYTGAQNLTPFVSATGPALAFTATIAGKSQVFVTTGTAGSGTTAITTGGAAFAAPGNFVAGGNKVYFTAADSGGNTEVYATDGTSLTRLDPSPNSLSPTYSFANGLTPFTTTGGVPALAFSGGTKTPGGGPINYQLYVTTDTSVGLVTKAVTTGGTVFGSEPSSITVSGHEVFFTATDSAQRTQFYATDGASVTRLDPNPNSLSPSYNGVSGLTAFNTATGPAVAFIAASTGANNAVNFQLYVASTNAAGALATQAITTGGTVFGALPGLPVVSGNTVYFTAVDQQNKTEVYATDGTSITRLDPNPTSLSDTYTNAVSLTPFTNAAGQSALAFVAQVMNSGVTSYQLFVTTGSPGAGTVAVTSGGAFGTAPGNLVVNGGKIYFTATDGRGGQEAYVTDGTSITRLDPQPNALSDTYLLTSIPSVSSYAITPLAAAKVDAASGVTPYTFTVSRAGPDLATATLSYSVAGSGATPAAVSLFVNPTGTVTFAAGQSLATLTVNVNGAAVPADQGFTVTLQGGTGGNAVAAASIAGSTALGTIVHNAPAPTYAIAAKDADKPDGATGLTPYTFGITRTGDTSAAATLSYAVAGSGTTPAPTSLFANPTGKAAFAAGAATATVTVNVNGASIAAPEAFAVTLSDPAGAIITPAAAGIIEPNVASASFSIAVADASKPDGLTGLTPYTFTVTRAGDASAATSVNYTVAGSGSNPTPGYRFPASSGAVAFAAGASSATITVQAIAARLTSPETFTVTIAGAPGTSVAAATSTGTIGANSTAPKLGPHDVALTGSHDQYLLSVSPDGQTVIRDMVAGRDGDTNLTGLQHVVFSDGTGVIDPTGKAESVTRLYQAALNRAPDSAGLDLFTNAVTNGGVTISALAATFTSSPEFMNAYGPLNNSAFVSQLYQNVLHRAPDAAGAQNFINVLNAGGSRPDALVSIANSTENRANLRPIAGDKNDGEAARLYQAALNRAPDAGGLSAFSNALGSGATPDQVATTFVTSPEFQKNYGLLNDPTDFVTQLYNNVLHRAPDSAGLQQFVNAINHGTSREGVLVGLSDSTENRLGTSQLTHDGWVFLG